MPIVKPVSVIVPAFNEGKEHHREHPLSPFPALSRLRGHRRQRRFDRRHPGPARPRPTTCGCPRPSSGESVPTLPIRGIYRSAVQPQLIVVDKVNGKKADAMNAGLNVSRYPLFCATDGDSVLEQDILLKIVRPFLEDPERTIAVGAIIRLSNGCVVRDGQVVRVGIPRNWIARIQILEYLRAFPRRPAGHGHDEEHADHLRRLRHLPQGRRLGLRRLPGGLHRRGHGPRRPHAEAHARAEEALPHPVHPRPDLLDAGARETERPVPAEEPVASGPHADPRPLPGHDLQSPLWGRRHVRHAFLRGLRDGRPVHRMSSATACS